MEELELSKEIKAQDKCVALFASHVEAEQAVKELGRADFNMRALSIVGMDYHTEENVVGFYNAGDRVKHWGKFGAFGGGIFGLIFAPALFWIPGIGPVLTGGIIGSALMGMLEGGLIGATVVGGMSALGAAMFSIGIPKDAVLSYEREIKAGKHLLMVHGTPSEVERAKGILSNGAEHVTSFEAC